MGPTIQHNLLSVEWFLLLSLFIELQVNAKGEISISNI